MSGDPLRDLDCAPGIHVFGECTGTSWSFPRFSRNRNQPFSVSVCESFGVIGALGNPCGATSSQAVSSLTPEWRLHFRLGLFEVMFLRDKD
jgi:hypothetical protein